MGIAQIRKAVVAFIALVIADLPIEDWADGDLAFTWSGFIRLLVVAVLGAGAVWRIPNAPPSTPADPAP